jgi:hypothetical protein
LLIITSIPHKIATKDIISRNSALYPLVKVSFKIKIVLINKIINFYYLIRIKKKILIIITIIAYVLALGRVKWSK